MRFKKTIFISLATFIILLFAWQLPLISRLINSGRMYLTSKNRASYYKLDSLTNIEDITKKLANDKTIPRKLRQPLINGKRRILIFKYKSDDSEVAGYFSYLVKGEHPTLIFLRGGNGRFGIMRPNNIFSYIPGYNVVGTLYRGNIYGGSDEFGGQDLNDTESLIKFFPRIEAYTNKLMNPPYAMLGVSRGATQMFGSLAHLPYVSARINKVISVSGALDLQLQMKKREEMKYLFYKKFKSQTKFKNFNEWLKYRNPVDLVKKLKPSIHILVLHGKNDDRVSDQEQSKFIKAAKKQKLSIRFIEIPGAGHSMESKIPKLWKYITQFLRSSNS